MLSWIYFISCISRVRILPRSSSLLTGDPLLIVELIYSQPFIWEINMRSKGGVLLSQRLSLSQVQNWIRRAISNQFKWYLEPILRLRSIGCKIHRWSSWRSHHCYGWLHSARKFGSWGPGREYLGNDQYDAADLIIQLDQNNFTS